jgi:hypothetical protein
VVAGSCHGMKNSAVVLDIALNALGNVRLQGTLRVRDVNKLRDVIETDPGSPATSFSIRVCAGKVADALKSAGFGGAGRYHLSVREC